MSELSDLSPRSPQSARNRMRAALTGLSAGLLYHFVRVVARSSRVRSEPQDVAARLAAASPAINVFWHGQFLMVPAFRPPQIPYSVVVARHGDAELLARLLDRFDMGLIRGAGAGERGRDRGGARALREALKALAAGTSVSITADVPPRDARRCGSGVITLARLAARPIVPLAVASSHYLALDTWSRMTINLPFSRLGVVVGDPISVPRDLDAAAEERLRQQVEDALNAATARAYALAGADPARATPRRRMTADGMETRPAPPPRLALKTYRAATSLLRPLAPLILRRRARQNKEDPARRDERLGLASRARPAGRLAWIHAASVGETNSILPLIGALQQARPDVSVLLTTGTVTSAALAAIRLGEGAIHQYVPLDAPQFVRRFLGHWRPDLALFVESEIWPNLVLETAACGVPMALVNARMSKKSYQTWRRRPGMAEPLFARFKLVLAQSEPLAERFAGLGARRALAVGNLKMDAPPLPVDGVALEALKAAIKDRPLLLAASTHDGEDELIAGAHKALARDLPGLLTIIAPRHPERGADIIGKLSELGLNCARRSAGEMPSEHSDVYLADTIGELGTLYALAPLAFIGGSFAPKGGQNPIEAVKLGSAVITGPHWHNFKDTYKELIRRKGACEVRSSDELAATVRALYGDRERLSDMRARATAVLDTMTGALDRTLEALLPLIPPKEA